MTISILLIFVLYLFQEATPTGIVHPYGAQSIVLSSTNAGDIADYNFTMMLDTPITASATVQISFPVSQYLPGLGLPNNFEVYAPYPNLITASLDSTGKTIIC